MICPECGHAEEIEAFLRTFLGVMKLLLLMSINALHVGLSSEAEK